MNDQKPVYRLMDTKGRVHIPKELRDAAEMQSGDIIRLDINKGVVSAKKVDIVEVGDKSPEAAEALVFAAVKLMPEKTQVALAAKLLKLIEQGGMENG